MMKTSNISRSRGGGPKSFVDINCAFVNQVRNFNMIRKTIETRGGLFLSDIFFVSCRGMRSPESNPEIDGILHGNFASDI